MAPTRMGLTPARCCPHPSRAISEVRGGGVLPESPPIPTAPSLPGQACLHGREAVPGSRLPHAQP